MNDSVLLHHCRARGGVLSQLISQRLLQSRPALLQLRLNNRGFADILPLVESDAVLLVGALELISVDTHSGAELLWKKLRNVQVLRVQGGTCIEQLLQAIDTIEKTEEWALSGLRELSISSVSPHCFIQSGGVSRLLKRVGGLTHLAMEHCDVDYYFCESAVDALSRLSVLQRLSLRGNPLEDSGTIVLSGAVEVMPKLREVDLSACRVGKTGLAALLGRLPLSVQELDVSSNALTGDALQGFSDSSTRLQSLKKLNLSGNDIGPEGCSALSVFLREVQSLTDLNLDCNYIGAVGFSHILSAYSTRHLMGHGPASLIVLGLSTNDITASALTALQPHLQQLYELRALDLSTNHFGPDGAVALARCIVLLPNLFSLDISENGIKDAGAAAIGKAAKYFVCLQVLNVSGNGIEKKGLVALAEGLKAAADVRSVNLARNLISDAAVGKASKHLAEMQDLGTLDFRGCKITAKSLRLLRSIKPQLMIHWDEENQAGNRD